MTARLARCLGLLSVLTLAPGCVVVPQNRRARLADKTMQAPSDPTDAHRKRKLYTSREAAAGGDGKAAGGGCACQ